MIWACPIIDVIGRGVSFTNLLSEILTLGTATSPPPGAARAEVILAFQYQTQVRSSLNFFRDILTSKIMNSPIPRFLQYTQSPQTAPVFYRIEAREFQSVQKVMLVK